MKKEKKQNWRKANPQIFVGSTYQNRMLWKPGIIKLHQQPDERACTKIRIHTPYYVANAMSIVSKYRYFRRIIYEWNSLPNHAEFGG